MATRELFPYAADRRATREYLIGVAQIDPTGLNIGVSDTGIKIYENGPPTVFIDATGSVMGRLGGETPSAVRFLNVVCEMLGIPERIEREVTDFTTMFAAARYMFGGKHIPTYSTPFLIVGKMALLAWRAEQRLREGAAHG